MYEEQINRIREKLPLAKAADTSLKVFGADQHKYAIGRPATEAEVYAFEQRYSISLPQCYRSFILQIANGGTNHDKSAAGPFYGIYPLGKNVDELLSEASEEHLKADCILTPVLTDQQGKSLVHADEHLTDQDYDELTHKLFAGVLPVGSQGCAYLHGLILNGPYRGRVVNLDIDKQKPHFTFEKNFLDWYERWLDEIISGELIREDADWFGYSKGGSEEDLLKVFVNSSDFEERSECLRGLLNKKRLSPEGLDKVLGLIATTTEKEKILLIQALCKSDYEIAKPFLVNLIQSNLLSVLQFIHWYAPSKSAEWAAQMAENMHRIDDDETFRFCTYVLKAGAVNYGHLIAPFTKNDNEHIRNQAFYALGQLNNKQIFIDDFIHGLNDESTNVLRTSLQALEGVKDDRLLSQYKKIAERFPEEQDYILVNLNHRLKEYGFNNKTVLNREVSGEKSRAGKWYQFWRK